MQWYVGCFELDNLSALAFVFWIALAFLFVIFYLHALLVLIVWSSAAWKMQECGLWSMPPCLLLWAAMLAHGSVRRSSNKHREDILSKVWRYILPPIQISRQYPKAIEMGFVIDCLVDCCFVRNSGQYAPTKDIHLSFILGNRYDWCLEVFIGEIG